MIKSFSNFVLLAIFAQISLAKDLGNIFTAINYIESTPNEVNAGAPFSYYKTSISFYLDVLKSKAAVGDTFNLTLPDVYEAYAYREKLVQVFYVPSEQGSGFAICEIRSKVGRTFGTNISCTISVDSRISRYKVLSGELELFLVFNGGARRDESELAKKWKVGSNQLTFNDAISGELTLTPKNITGHSTLLAINSGTKYLFYYLSSESLCPDGIVGGEFSCALSGDRYIDFIRTESFIALSVNPFGQPTADVDLADFNITLGLLNYTVSFGPIPQGQHFYFSADALATSIKFITKYDLTVQCASGKEVTEGGSITIKRGVGIYDTPSADKVLDATATSTGSTSS